MLNIKFIFIFPYDPDLKMQLEDTEMDGFMDNFENLSPNGSLQLIFLVQWVF